MQSDQVPTVMAIGGAVDLARPALLEAFYHRAGGRGARLIILPTASELSEAGREVLEFWQGLGLDQEPCLLDLRRREQAQDPANARLIEAASGIFLTGGAQLRLTAQLGGTLAHQALLSAYQRGAIVAGTSAGAAALGKVMIAYGRGGATPRLAGAQLAPGLGLTDGVIFDQHFRQRDRLGRLLLAVCLQPGVIGVGVDENTAAILQGRWLTMIGQNAVTIVDGSQIADTDVAERSGRQPVAVTGAIVHVLTAGGAFDLEHRRAFLRFPSQHSTQ